MPAILWLIIFVIRLLLNDNTATAGGQLAEFFKARGKVIGHRGPDIRSFRGRAGRREWWITMAWSAVAGAVVSAIPVVGPVLALPWTISSLAVSARRLHDLTLSAWLQIIPMAIAGALLAGYGIARYALRLHVDDALVMLGGVAIGFSYVLFALILGFAPGKGSSNLYGEADIVV